MTDPFYIRNFCIIAHIDHGKSTLADRFLERTGAISKREFKEQMLDSMDLEREKGITIKSQAVRMQYEDSVGDEYQFNLIDTPGHVDFTYEVSRSLAACEGALLLVDATQGVQAQTLLNLYQAEKVGLKIIPVINKIDMQSARIDRAKIQLLDRGFEEEDMIEVSAKEGTGVDELLELIVDEVPPPEAEADKRLKGLIFDSHYDSYEGAVVYTRLFEGRVKPGDRVRFMQKNKDFEVTSVGVFNPEMEAVEELRAGEVGYLLAGIKTLDQVKIGDTITGAEAPIPESEKLPGYREVKPMVFCGFYPHDGDRYEEMRDSLKKLALNDAAFEFEPAVSNSLGFGFKCGFLGLLHMEITRERLEREFGIDLLVTAPNVRYKVKMNDGSVRDVSYVGELPDPNEYEEIREPIVELNCYTPDDHIGDVMKLCEARRADFKTMEYLDETMVRLEYEIPLAEIVVDFFDALKSATRGYGSMDYEFIKYRESDLVKLQILLNKDPVEPLAFIVHRDKSYRVGRRLTKKLKKILPRHQFEVPIQASIGSRVLARETKPAQRKDVTAKCYGGDVTRKRKLLEEQKEGKKRLKQMGKVDVPQEAFLSILTLDDD